MRNTILLLFLLSGLLSCRPQQITTHRIEVRDSIIVKEVPIMVKVPGATIQAPSINIDSLVNLLKAGIPTKEINRTLFKEDPETGLRIGLLIDELGNLTALCEQQDKIIEQLIRELTHYRETTKETTIEKKPSFWDRFYGVLHNLLLPFMVGILIVLSLFNIMRR